MMTGEQQIIVAIFVVIVALVAIRLFTTQLKWVFKLLISTLLGFAALIAFDLLSGFTGVTIGVNLLNAAVIGILGLPGFGLVLLVNWLYAL